MPDSEPSKIAELIPAATVICLRDGAKGIEALLLRRNRNLKAFGGAWVFPGGRVDQADAPGADELSRARTAAVREAQEETGLRLIGEQLVPLSLWIPPVQEKRRFSTWFFLAHAGSQTIEIDGGEIHDFKWISPKNIIDQTPDAETMIMPPTYVSLHQLCNYESVSDALIGIERRANDRFETRFTRSEQGFVTYWQDDAAYDCGDLAKTGRRHRLVAKADGWEYLRSEAGLDL